MKNIRLILALGFFSLPVFGCLPTAWHEFDVFGRENFYISHLAAFHSIHAYQVIAEVELDPASAELFRQSKYARGRLSPTTKGKTGAQLQDRLEDWELPVMMHAGKSFHAEIHGGSETIAADVTVKIKRIIRFKMYKDEEGRPKELPYLLFGTSSEAFLAHLHVQFPDFDQILAIDLKSGDAPMTSAQLRFPGTDNLPHAETTGDQTKYVFYPLQLDQEASGVSDATKQKWTVKVKGQLRYNVVEREY